MAKRLSGSANPSSSATAIQDDGFSAAISTSFAPPLESALSQVAAGDDGRAYQLIVADRWSSDRIIRGQAIAILCRLEVLRARNQFCEPPPALEINGAPISDHWRRDIENEIRIWLWRHDALIKESAP